MCAKLFRGPLLLERTASREEGGYNRSNYFSNGDNAKYRFDLMLLHLKLTIFLIDKHKDRYTIMGIREPLVHCHIT